MTLFAKYLRFPLIQKQLNFSLHRHVNKTPSNPFSKITFLLNNPGSSPISIGQNEICVAHETCTLSTYGLINCFAVGGIFPDENSSFLTHRSPSHVQYLPLDTKKSISKITPYNNLLEGDFCIFKLSDSTRSDLLYKIGDKSYTYNELIDYFLVSHLQDCYPSCKVHTLSYEPFYPHIGFIQNDKRISGGLAIVDSKRGIFETSLGSVLIT